MSIEALHPGPTSAEVIESIFAMHFAPPTPDHYDALRVLDMTSGRRTFWNWDYRDKYPFMRLWFNDNYQDIPNPLPDDIEYLEFTKCDFTRLPWPDNYFDIAVFDPPHSAHGPPSDDIRDKDRYGSTRDQQGAPQNHMNVLDLLVDGIKEATRVAQLGIIIKTMDIIESGEYWSHIHHAEYALRFHEFNIVDKVYFLPSRRPQPDEARGAEVRHFRNRPSVFIVGKPRNERA